MTHLSFLYYVIAYSVGLPALVVVCVAYRRTRQRTLGAYIAFLLSVSAQLVLVAALRYEDAVLPTVDLALGLITRRLYFLVESSVVLTLPLLCHRLSEVRNAATRDRLFLAAFLVCLGLVLSPLSLSYRAQEATSAVRAGFYVYRVLFFLSVLYGLAVLVTHLRRMPEPAQRTVAILCLSSTVLLLWETLHCELFPVLGHTLPAIALSPLGYTVTSAVLLTHVIRTHLLPRPLTGTAGIRDEVLGSHGISPREREIVGLLSDGHTNREIAHRLFISDSTVRSHVKSVYRKLGVRNRVQLVNALLHLAAPPQQP